MRISEKKLYGRSKVTSLLMSRDNYTDFVYKENKTNQFYEIWTRPTIPWSLECESKGHSRSSILDHVTNVKSVVVPAMIGNFAFFFVILIFTAIGLCCMCCTQVCDLKDA